MPNPTSKVTKPPSGRKNSMNKSELLKELKKTLEEGSETIQVEQTHNSPFEIGKAYFIRTVTYFVTGKVKDIVGQFLVLEDGAWIADTGRFSDALESGEFSEVEPVECDIYVNMSSISDAFPWTKKLPRSQK